MTQSDVLHWFVVIEYAPRVFLKLVPIVRLWETQKFLDLVQEFIKMSGLLSLPVFWEELIDWKAVEDSQQITKAHDMWLLTTRIGIWSVAQIAGDSVKKLGHNASFVELKLELEYFVMCLQQARLLL